MTTQISSGAPVGGTGTQVSGQDANAAGEGFAQSLLDALTGGPGAPGADGQVTDQADAETGQEIQEGQVDPALLVDAGVLAVTLSAFLPTTPATATATSAVGATGVESATVGATAAKAAGGPGAGPAVVVADGEVADGDPASPAVSGRAKPGPSATVVATAPVTGLPVQAAAPTVAPAAVATQAAAAVQVFTPVAKAGPVQPAASTEQVVAASANDDATGVSRQAPVQVVATGPALNLAPAAVPTAQRVQELAGQVSAHIRAVANMPDGSYAMTVQAHPADLGPVTISVRLHEGAVEVAMAATNEHARAALTEASPAIRRELAVAGLICDRVSVSADHGTGSSYQQAGHDAQPDRGARQGPQQDRRARTWMDSGEPHETQTPALVTTKTTPTGVDVRV